MVSPALHLGTGRTGGRDATTGVIPGRYALSVGLPDVRPPKGWKWTALNSVAQLESGHTPSRKHPEYWNGGIPWIGIKDATENHGRVLQDTYQHVAELGLQNSSSRLLPANTVCLSRTASVGFVVVMGRPMATSQDFVNWVCGPNLDPHFLKYVLLAENEALWRFASGTTHQTIYYPEAKAFHICLPPFPEQRAITALLCALDDKIELNRQMNETLEALAQTLFKNWFVDAAATKLPKGWRESTIGEEVRVVGGSTPSTTKPEFWEGGEHHWATPKDLAPLNSPVLLNTERKITELGLQQIGSGLLPVGTVLLSSRAPIGYMAIAEVPVAVNQGFIAMICNGSLPNHYVRLWTKQNMEAIKGRANGTTFMEISKSNFRTLPVLVPPQSLLDEFQRQVEPLHRRVVSNLEESRTLAELRDALLPKLLSGELRVPVKLMEVK
jgi:type I restriction enzyme S subunit